MSISTMEAEIYKKLAEEEAMENASMNSFNSAASRLRAAAAAVQPSALAMLNSVRGGGLGGSLFPQASAPAPPSLYEMALFQQRMAMEEQSRMRLMAQAAVAMRQQQQQLQGLAELAQQHQRLPSKKRRLLVQPPKISEALQRLHKKRKVVSLPPLCLERHGAKTSGGFFLPKPGGLDYTPSIKPLVSFKSTWSAIVKKSKGIAGDEDQKHAFVRYQFEKSLAQNRAGHGRETKSDINEDRDNRKTRVDDMKRWLSTDIKAMPV